MCNLIIIVHHGQGWIYRAQGPLAVATFRFSLKVDRFASVFDNILVKKTMPLKIVFFLRCGVLGLWQFAKVS